jgi:hypothetical protein
LCTRPAVFLHWALASSGAVIALTGCHGSHGFCGENRNGAWAAKRFVATPPDLSDETERSIAEDPLAFLRSCRDHCAVTVRDYRCQFTKREPGITGLVHEEVIAVRFRQDPLSVDFRWLRNPGLARRVTYVAGRWNDGRELASIEPHGLIGVFLPREVKRPIHGVEMRRASRRTIDQFGFKSTLDLIIQHAEMAKDDPRYSLRYLGKGDVGGRPAYILERRLPLTRIDQPYPDRVLIVGIDEQWLIPTACHAFTDDHGQSLLGSYVTTAVELNVGLTDADF